MDVLEKIRALICDAQYNMAPMDDLVLIVHPMFARTIPGGWEWEPLWRSARNVPDTHILGHQVHGRFRNIPTILMTGIEDVELIQRRTGLRAQV